MPEPPAGIADRIWKRILYGNPKATAACPSKRVRIWHRTAVPDSSLHRPWIDAGTAPDPHRLCRRIAHPGQIHGRSGFHDLALETRHATRAECRATCVCPDNPLIPPGRLADSRSLRFEGAHGRASCPSSGSAWCRSGLDCSSISTGRNRSGSPCPKAADCATRSRSRRSA